MDGRVNVRVVTRNRIGGEEETLRFAGEGVRAAARAAGSCTTMP